MGRFLTVLASSGKNQSEECRNRQESQEFLYIPEVGSPGATVPGTVALPGYVLQTCMVPAGGYPGVGTLGAQYPGYPPLGPPASIFLDIPGIPGIPTAVLDTFCRSCTFLGFLKKPMGSAYVNCRFGNSRRNRRNPNHSGM